MDLSVFIKYIQLDESKRILVSIQEFLEPQLASPENRKMMKDTLANILGEDFVQLEIGKNVCRVTVREGTEEAAIVKIREGLMAAIEMAMSFMNQQGEPEVQ